MMKLALGWIGLLAGVALAWACAISVDPEGLLAGDAALSRPFETNFRADLVALHGAAARVRDRNDGEEEIARRRVAVSEGLLAELRVATDAWTAGRREKILRPVALHLAARVRAEGGLYQVSADGPWKILADGPSVVFPARAVTAFRYADKDASSFESAYASSIKQLPTEFRLYLRSLDYEAADGLALCDELLTLPPAERTHLTAAAYYRRARLRMALLDRGGSDDALRRALAATRADFLAVGAAVRAGAPDPGGLALAAEGWLAHLRCAVLPLPRLRALGEADLGQALRIYLDQRRRGESTADDSIFALLRIAAGSGDLRECARDPQLRRLMTAYMASGTRQSGEEAAFPLDDVAGHVRAWLAALREAKVDFAEDAVRLAALEYRLGDWEACARTLRDAPAQDPLAALLRARLDLRAGRRAEAGETLGRLLRPFERRFSAVGYFTDENGATDAPDSGEPVDLTKLSPYRFDETDPAMGQVSKARSELATLLLAQGRYLESLEHFYRLGETKDFAYIAECVLKVDELKAYVDRSWPEDAPTAKPKVKPAGAKPDEEPEECTPLPPAQTIRHLLARRLFRAGRPAEALPYYPAEVRPSVAHYLELMTRAENPTRARRDRADAYWRAALVLRELDDVTQFCEFGPDWTSSSDLDDDTPGAKPLHWHDAGGLPRSRVQPVGDEAESLLAPPGADEQARVQAWMAANLDHPDRAHRSARYGVARLAWRAVELLPDDDVAGSRILQFAGGLLKYMEPPAAQPYYRQLATRFKGTELGAAARRARWFTTLACEPDPDWIQKGR